ncbi:zeta toxin family protein [Streptomyces erythrochromogenes]|uniref:zeta toxin family protein n=1 Tax=Streptomyces erythrochromogenes TaxID=285574 RepID=UPI0037F9A408
MNDEYRQLYQEIQRRMARGGDLSPGPRDTQAAFGRSAEWDRSRMRMQGEVLERFKAENAHRPRGGRAVLMTAGAPGAGKGFAQGNLDTWQREDTELGRRLAAAHGLDLKDYVVLNPDDFKQALFEAGGLPRLDPQAMALPFGRELTPAELSGLLHREASELRNQFEEWAREGGYNLLYDATLANQDDAAKLLSGLRDEHYDQRVILSVEVPREQSLAQNANRWYQGRLLYEQGRDNYGGRMSPDQMIEALYNKTTTGSGRSIGRENAEKLADQGLATGLITSDRGTFPTQAPTAAPTRATVFQQGDTRLSIAAAGRLRSTQGTATPTTPPAQATAPTLPRQTPPAPGRTR